MILPDLNLLLYAYDLRAPQHAAAARWWRGCLSGDETVVLLAAVAFGFVRLITGKVFASRFTPAEAGDAVRAWLKRPQVQLFDVTPRTLDITTGLLETLGTAGNLVTDAQIAAVALETGAVVHTADTDFARFPGVRWYNPILGTRGR
ncbi:MAG TPA: TA system VapC family ribonuclease toxin [Terriglobales bacterium]|nr:TA system VapC family ribonuclease toxin [Terriglobales bacterium]